MEDGHGRDFHMQDSQGPVMTADDADRDTTCIGSQNIPQMWSAWPHKDCLLSPTRPVLVGRSS